MPAYVVGTARLTGNPVEYQISFLCCFTPADSPTCTQKEAWGSSLVGLGLHITKPEESACSKLDESAGSQVGLEMTKA